MDFTINFRTRLNGKYHEPTVKMIGAEDKEKCLLRLFIRIYPAFVVNEKNSYDLGLKFILVTFIKQLVKRINKNNE